MPDSGKVIERLQKVSHYFKSMLKVGYDGDADIYREHRESVKMAIELLKEQVEIVRCSECENWVPGYITDRDDFIPPKCGKYQQMVGHSADDYCSLGKKQEGR